MTKESNNLHLQLIDSHCHLDLLGNEISLTQILREAGAAYVTEFVLPGVTAGGWQRLMKLCTQYQGFHGAPGLHPLYMTNHRREHLELLKDIAKHETTVAIGEIGLDFYHTKSNNGRQQELFEQQLSIAQSRKLPVCLHVRKAHDQVLATLRRKKFNHGGIVHAFSGSYQQAMQYYNLGFCIGVGGTITYNRAKKVRQTVTDLPKQALVLETDSPDIPLSGHQGKPNMPRYLKDVAQTLAGLRDEQLEHTARYTTENCRRVLDLPAVINTL